MSLHAVPAVLLVVDLLFLSPPWTIGVLPALGISSVLAGGYWVWVEECYRHNGWYVQFSLLPILVVYVQLQWGIGEAVVCGGYGMGG